MCLCLYACVCVSVCMHVRVCLCMFLYVYVCAFLCLQAGDFRLYSQEVVELAHGVSLLLLLPAADSVCSAPGQSNLYTPLSGFLHLPLQMFEMGIAHVHAFRQTS